MRPLGEERRRAIIEEIAQLLPRRVTKEPWMFTAPELAEQTGRRYADILLDLRRLVALGVLECEPDGYNPATGRQCTLFWRPEDKPPPATPQFLGKDLDE